MCGLGGLCRAQPPLLIALLFLSWSFPQERMNLQLLYPAWGLRGGGRVSICLLLHKQSTRSLRPIQTKMCLEQGQGVAQSHMRSLWRAGGYKGQGPNCGSDSRTLLGVHMPPKSIKLRQTVKHCTAPPRPTPEPEPSHLTDCPEDLTESRAF